MGQGEKDNQAVPLATTPRRGRVLVIDDDPMIVRVVQRALGRVHDVVALADGFGAIDLVRSGERFDVIFCDLAMPEMSGMDVYDEVSRVAPEQAQAFVFLTGGAFNASAQAFLEQVPNQRLDKPFDTSVLKSLVSDRLG